MKRVVCAKGRGQETIYKTYTTYFSAFRKKDAAISSNLMSVCPSVICGSLWYTVVDIDVLAGPFIIFSFPKTKNEILILFIDIYYFRSRKKKRGQMWSEMLIAEDSDLNENFYKMCPVNESQSLRKLNLFAVNDTLPSKSQGLLQVSPFAQKVLVLRVGSEAEQRATAMTEFIMGCTMIQVTVVGVDAMNP